MLKLAPVAAAAVFALLMSPAQAQTPAQQPGVVTGTMQELPVTTTPFPPAAPPQPPASPQPPSTVNIITTIPNLPAGGGVVSSGQTLGPQLRWSNGGRDAPPNMSKVTTDGQNPPNFTGVGICRITRADGVYIGSFTREPSGRNSLLEACFFAANGKHAAAFSYDHLLRSPLMATSWVGVVNRQIPANAVFSTTEPGRGAAICRVPIDKKIRTGWVGNGLCHIGTHEVSLSFPYYDVLVTGTVQAQSTVPLYTSQAQGSAPNPFRFDGLFNMFPGK